MMMMDIFVFFVLIYSQVDMHMQTSNKMPSVTNTVNLWCKSHTGKAFMSQGVSHLSSLPLRVLWSDPQSSNIPFSDSMYTTQLRKYPQPCLCSLQLSLTCHRLSFSDGQEVSAYIPQRAISSVILQSFSKLQLHAGPLSHFLTCII